MPISKKTKVIITTACMLVVICLLSFSAVGIVNIRLHQEIDDNGQIAPIQSVFKTPDEYQGKVVNLLCVGHDNSVGLTDVLMYVTVDLENQSASVLRIPRDTFVGDEIPSGKINAVYNNPPDGVSKINGLIQKINEMFQLPVDHYITITLEGFREVIDSMGGVDIDVPQTIYYDEGMVIPEGEQHLDGQKAEWFVRYRAGYANADLGRIDAQNLFIRALAEKAKNMGKLQLATLLADDYQYVTTDMTVGELLSIAEAAFNVDLDKLEMFTVPGYADYHNGLSVYEIDAEETAEILNEHFRPYSDKVEAEDLDIPYTNSYSNYDDYGYYDNNTWEESDDYYDDGGYTDYTASQESAYTPPEEEYTESQPSVEEPSQPIEDASQSEQASEAPSTSEGSESGTSITEENLAA